MLKVSGWAATAAFFAVNGSGPPAASAQGVQRRVTLDLNTERDRQKVGGQCRVASGLVPGEPNEGLVAGRGPSPARLPDYDDSAWEICEHIGERRSSGLTFAWWRITVELPEEVDGVPLAGAQVYFETIADNYGEVWVDGALAPGAGIIGNNAPQRVRLSQSAVPGTRYVIACLAANGPLAAPGGAVFLRYATLAFEYVS